MHNNVCLVCFNGILLFHFARMALPGHNMMYNLNDCVQWDLLITLAAIDAGHLIKAVIQACFCGIRCAFDYLVCILTSLHNST
jgi:hypothetical protein